VAGLIADARRTRIQEALRLLRMPTCDDRKRSRKGQRGQEQQATVHAGLSDGPYHAPDGDA
jgi:hypothetical protein